MNAHMDALPVDNIEAEQAVLGTILLHNTAFDAVSSILEPEHFNEHIHRLIFKAISDLLAKGKGANPVTIMNFLPADEQLTEDKNVRQYVAQLVGSMAFPVSMVRDMAVSVYEMWLRRTALSECDEFIARTRELSPDKDILDEIGLLEERLSEIRAKRLTDEGRNMAGAKYLASMTEAAKRGQVNGVPHCLKEISRVLSEPCFEVGNLYGLLSSSGEGKTSLTLQIISHALEKGHPVQFLSYDQSAVQCLRQMVAQKYGVTATQQRDAKLTNKEWEWINEFGNWIDRQPFEVVKCTNQTAAQLKGYARQFIRRYGNGKVPLIVVDHIRRITPEDRRADHGTQATQKNAVFKAAAEELSTAWLILNQRSTSGMSRDNPRPTAADLFGGEGAVQDYDAILYLYRYKKFFEARKKIANGSAAWAKINEVFPEAVRIHGEDIAELGTIKSRFGDPNITENVEFEAYLTRYRTLKQQEQPELLP